MTPPQLTDDDGSEFWEAGSRPHPEAWELQYLIELAHARDNGLPRSFNVPAAADLLSFHDCGATDV